MREREKKLLLTDGILAEQLLHYICCYFGGSQKNSIKFAEVWGEMKN